LLSGLLKKESSIVNFDSTYKAAVLFKRTKQVNMYNLFCVFNQRQKRKSNTREKCGPVKGKEREFLSILINIRVI